MKRLSRLVRLASLHWQLMVARIVADDLLRESQGRYADEKTAEAAMYAEDRVAELLEQLEACRA